MSEYTQGGHIPGGPVPLSAGCLNDGYIITRAQLEALGPNPLLDELNRRRDDEDGER